MGSPQIVDCGGIVQARGYNKGVAMSDNAFGFAESIKWEYIKNDKPIKWKYDKKKECWLGEMETPIMLKPVLYVYNIGERSYDNG